MYIKRINPYVLTYRDIDSKVTRVKMLIFNIESKILLCNVEGNETLTMVLIRELNEETEIVLNSQNFNPFIKIEKWNKNHFNTGKKCLSEIYNYSLYTDYTIDKEKMNLDNSEKRKISF